MFWLRLLVACFCFPGTSGRNLGIRRPEGTIILSQGYWLHWLLSHLAHWPHWSWTKWSPFYMLPRAVPNFLDCWELASPGLQAEGMWSPSLWKHGLMNIDRHKTITFLFQNTSPSGFTSIRIPSHPSKKATFYPQKKQFKTILSLKQEFNVYFW